MKQLTFPHPFHHKHPPVQNVTELFHKEFTFGQKTADWVAKIIGSWKFIIWQSVFFAVWIALNVTAFIQHWDPYPFILMNLLLSTQAAYTAPIIMMSQNRQEEKDRLEARNDYIINQKAEEEVRAILDHLAAQDTALQEIYRLLVERQDTSLLEPPN